ncbi:MAG: hypothetical protein Q9170_005112 [Blastenia crenularia]
MKTRTIAEQMLGPASTVAPPRDANTGSSITNLGDFNGIHVPENVRTPPAEHVPISHAETSDPEDLALSSGDEGHEERVDSARASQVAQSPQGAADNTFYNDSGAEEAPQQWTDSASESSPTARQRSADYDNKNARRQATIYHESPAQNSELSRVKQPVGSGSAQIPDADLSQFPIPGARAQQGSIMLKIGNAERGGKGLIQ